MAEPRVPTSVWWAPQTWEQAKGAYNRDKEAGVGPATFNGWIHAAIQAHVARAASGRAALELPVRPEVSAAEGMPRTHPLLVSTREVLEAARAEDEAAGRPLSVSAWIYEAVAASISSTQASTDEPGSGQQ